MLSDAERRFLDSRRVGHLATVDATGVPHVVPVCFAVAGDEVYVAIDEKPKRTDRPLKRLRNIAANPSVALVADYYDEDWTRLGWIMLRGQARILHEGGDYDRAHVLLRGRYRQYVSMVLEGLPLIAIRIERVACWGRLDPGAGLSPEDNVHPG